MNSAIVIGAGVGGLTAAIDLARAGVQTTVVERAGDAGGKIRQFDVGGALIDAGPTVFTMRWVFEALFEEAGAQLDEYLTLHAADVLARHAWRQGGELDLFADIAQSADAIGAFAGAVEARGFLAFCEQRADMFRTLRDTYIADQRPSLIEFCRRVGLANFAALQRTKPLSMLWDELGRHFKDQRLRQLFARYSTYVGSSPWRTPATLMLIAHVEQEGVWHLDGGMRALAGALQSLGERLGVNYRFNAPVGRLVVEQDAAKGVVLSSGEALRADAVVYNGEVSALDGGLLGDGVRPAAPATPRNKRSLSAMIWCMRARTSGFPLDFHNVFFTDDYRREFDSIFNEQTISRAPTVYICAQDRSGGDQPEGAERLLVLINAPANGDRATMTPAEIDQHEADVTGVLSDCGLSLEDRQSIVVTPTDFHDRFPATGGALYGRASHGMMASFERAGARSRLPGLYLTGGSVHPGPGVPMAAMSGRLAAARALSDAGMTP